MSWRPRNGYLFSVLRLNKRIDYGILILSSLGRRPGEQVSAKEISDSFRLSRHMVANILKSLSKAGLVEAGRGVYGGYKLAREAREIQMIDVIEALEGPFALLACCAHEGPTPPPGCTTTSNSCTARPLMKMLNHKIRELLKEITVEHFCKRNPPGTRNLEESSEAASQA